MNKLIIVLASFVLLVSCSKSKNSANYSVNGVQDISVANYSTTPMALQIALISGTQNPVSIKINGMPANVKDSIAPASGTPTYNSVIYFTADDATAGSYPLSLVSTGSSGESKTFKFNMAITGGIKPNKWYVNNEVHAAASTDIGQIGQIEATADNDNVLEVFLPDMSTITTTKTLRVVSLEQFITLGGLDVCAIVVSNNGTGYESIDANKTITVTPGTGSTLKIDIPSQSVANHSNSTDLATLQGHLEM